VELGLAPKDPMIFTVGVDLHVLLLPEFNGLVAPLRDLDCGLQLDRVPHGGNNLDVAANWDGV